MSRPTGAARAVVAGTIALLTAAGVSAASSATAGSHRVYRAPFKIGPSGGDSFSYHQAGTDGSVTVARVYPVPGVINCTKGGPYAKLLVLHRATRPVRSITVTYDSAMVDPFTFVMVGLHDARHHWLGTTTQRGMVTGNGVITLRPSGRQPRLPQTLTIEFGLQQSSACPNADEGTIHFSSVEVRS
jgi:hypothetical protein